MKLYHTTNEHAAAVIAKRGFKDASGSDVFVDLILKGVFFADWPLDCNEGAKGESTFILDIPEKSIAKYEIIEVSRTFRKGYREWCIPAKVVNQYFKRGKVHDIYDIKGKLWKKNRKKTA